MKKIAVILLALILLSFSNQQFAEKNLIGTWKITKVKNSVGSEIGSSAFEGETFTYSSNHTISHFNPELPFLSEETGKWEIVKNIIYQYNIGEDKKTYGEILKLNNKVLVIEQTRDKVVTTIFYGKIR